MRWDCGIFCLTKSGDRCTKTSGFALQATNALQKDTTMVHQFTFLEIWFRGACGFCIVAALCYENAVSRDIYIPRGQGSEYSSALGDRACRCERCHWKARGRNPAPAPPAAELASAAEIIVANFS